MEKLCKEDLVRKSGDPAWILSLRHCVTLCITCFQRFALGLMPTLGDL